MGPWSDKFSSILCQLYRFWGGECDDLPSDCWLAAEIVMACFPPAPTFSNQKEHDRFIQTLYKLQAQLALPDNPLTAQQTYRIEVWIQDVLDAVVPVNNNYVWSEDGGAGSEADRTVRLVLPTDDEQSQRRAA